MFKGKFSTDKMSVKTYRRLVEILKKAEMVSWSADDETGSTDVTSGCTPHIHSQHDQRADHQEASREF